MNDKNPETNVPSDSKPGIGARLRGRVSSDNSTVKAKTSFGHKAKNVAAVVGVVSVAGYIAATVARKKSIKVEATLPDVAVTTDDTKS